MAEVETHLGEVTVGEVAEAASEEVVTISDRETITLAEVAVAVEEEVKEVSEAVVKIMADKATTKVVRRVSSKLEATIVEDVAEEGVDLVAADEEAIAEVEELAYLFPIGIMSICVHLKKIFMYHILP